MRLAIVFVVGVLAALSLPGVRAAQAEADLVPPASRLFAYGAPPATSSCAVGSTRRAPAVSPQDVRRRLAALVAAEPGDRVEALNGRGYGYHVERDVTLEVMKIQQEAKRLRAARNR